jgi:hypothetical protein
VTNNVATTVATITIIIDFSFDKACNVSGFVLVVSRQARDSGVSVRHSLTVHTGKLALIARAEDNEPWTVATALILSLSGEYNYLAPGIFALCD